MCQICVPGSINTKLPNNNTVFGAPNRKWFMPKVADDGTLNGIDYSAAGVITQASIDALINNPDPSKRLYPMPVMEEITDEREDTIKETPDSGRAYNVRKGNRNVAGNVYEVDHNFYAQIVGLECENNLMEYTIDECGNVKGGDSLVGDQKLAGAPIQRNTFDLKLMPASQSTVSKVMLTYQIDTGFRDENYAMLLVDDFEINPLDFEGLLGLDYSGGVASEATQEIDLYIYSEYAGVKNYLPAKNLLVASFEVDNATGSTTTVPDTVEETPNGQYKLTMPAATFVSTDVLTVRVVADGYNDILMQAKTITAGA